jgi:hypothetical protein
MNGKIWLGFLGGAVVAFLGSYAIMHREAPAPAAAPAPVAEAAPPVAVERVAEPVPAPVPKPAPARKKIAQKPVVAEPSATAPEPVTVAAAPPPPPPAPAVAPAPAAPEPEPVRASAPPPPPRILKPEPAPQPNTVTLPSGTPVAVRLLEALSTKKNRSGDEFAATLDQPLEVDGFVIAERGARVEGKIVEAEEAGRVKGLARMTLELTAITTSDGQKVPIRTARFEKIGPESKRQDAEKVGIGAVLGTIIGAAAGGGKGAGIGAAAGGAAGAGTVAATRGKPAELPTETRITFRTDQPVTITEQRR